MWKLYFLFILISNIDISSLLVGLLHFFMNLYEYKKVTIFFLVFINELTPFHFSLISMQKNKLRISLLTGNSWISKMPRLLNSRIQIFLDKVAKFLRGTIKMYMFIHEQDRTILLRDLSIRSGNKQISNLLLIFH